jgi:ABC-type Fe3+ transport system permease subunit
VAMATKEKMETKRAIIFLLGLFIFPLSQSLLRHALSQVDYQQEPPP